MLKLRNLNRELVILLDALGQILFELPILYLQGLDGPFFLEEVIPHLLLLCLKVHLPLLLLSFLIKLEFELADLLQQPVKLKVIWLRTLGSSAPPRAV